MPERDPGWEPIWQGNGEAQAHIVAGGLNAGGIQARIQGARPIQGFPHAFQTDTWAVFVPSALAQRARDLLRDRGESAGIVEGGLDAAGRTATLRFALYLLLGCVIFALVMAIRQAI